MTRMYAWVRDRKYDFVSNTSQRKEERKKTKNQRQKDRMNERENESKNKGREKSKSRKNERKKERSQQANRPNQATMSTHEKYKESTAIPVIFSRVVAPEPNLSLHSSEQPGTYRCWVEIETGVAAVSKGSP